VPVRAKEPVVAAAAVGAPPDHAADPHGEPHGVAGETAVGEPATLPESAPQLEIEQAPAPEPGRPSPMPMPAEVVSSAAKFRTRTATLARLAATTAQQRRALLAALLAVAMLSASAGILAGRWLAVRTAVTSGATR
jgi:hypothetical protein